MQSETELVKLVLKRLEPYFNVTREVWDDTGKNRIDAIIASEDQEFGIEFKKDGNKRGNDLGVLVQQAIRYSKTTFNGRKVPVLICPAISYNYFVLRNKTILIDGVEHHIDRHQKHHEHHTFNGFLGTFNIGEIRTTRKHGDQRIWFICNNKRIWAEKMNFNEKWYEQWISRL